MSTVFKEDIECSEETFEEKFRPQWLVAWGLINYTTFAPRPSKTESGVWCFYCVSDRVLSCPFRAENLSSSPSAREKGVIQRWVPQCRELLDRPTFDALFVGFFKKWSASKAHWLSPTVPEKVHVDSIQVWIYQATTFYDVRPGDVRVRQGKLLQVLRVLRLCDRIIWQFLESPW